MAQFLIWRTLNIQEQRLLIRQLVIKHIAFACNYIWLPLRQKIAVSRKIQHSLVTQWHSSTPYTWDDTLGHVVIQAHASLPVQKNPPRTMSWDQQRSLAKCHACKLNCPFRVWEMADSNPMKQMKDNDLTQDEVKLIRPRWPSSRRVDTTGWYSPWSVTCQG